jgi:hypothetical protein
MVSSAIVLVPLALAISGQAFRVPGQNLQSRALDALLVGRQIIGADGTDEIPAECKASCDPALTNFSDETCFADIKCICTDANMKNYAECMNCVLKTFPDSNPEKSTVIEQSKSGADNIVQACKASGITVASPAIGDGSSSASSGGAAGSGSGGDTKTGADTTGTNVKQDDKDGAALSVRVSGGLLGLVGLVGALVISL